MKNTWEDAWAMVVGVLIGGVIILVFVWAAKPVDNRYFYPQRTCMEGAFPVLDCPNWALTCRNRLYEK